MSDILAALTRAVEAAPDDYALRTHLASMLLDAGHREQAVAHLAAVLGARPGDPHASELMTRALSGFGPPNSSPVQPGPSAAGTDRQPPPAQQQPSAQQQPPVQQPPPAQQQPPVQQPPAGQEAPGQRPGQPQPPRYGGPAATPEGSDHKGPDFDWHAAEDQLGDIAEPMFVGENPAEPSISAWDVERSQLTLADVGGMAEVKQRLEVSFLAPLRNPELRAMYGKSLRGGLLLYGPPGCGKTFVARAIAGEMGAKFISVGLSDVLDMWIGSSEKNIHELFGLARREAPVVLFLDELDALGQKRSQTRHSSMRGTVNQLLAEFDGVDSVNEGVFVLAATNQPWDIDPALRRPGRLDRTLLVLPPDEPARQAILRHHLGRRPVAGVDVAQLAAATDGYSGADLAHVCETAAEKAMMDSVRTGQVRMIGMADLQAALREVRPSVEGWFQLARNVVTFADPEGTYADLRAYMKKTRRL